MIQSDVTKVFLSTSTTPCSVLCLKSSVAVFEKVSVHYIGYALSL